MSYRPTRPWAHAPLVPQRVPPAWRPPMPVGMVRYPQPPPPGRAFLSSFPENYCGGGASRRGVSVASFYGTSKDAGALGSVYGRQPLLPASPMDLGGYEEDYPEANHSVRLGSFNRSSDDEADAEILEILGMDPDEIDDLFAAEEAAYGDEDPPFAPMSRLFRRDGSGTSKVERTQEKVDRLSNRLGDLQQRHGAPESTPAPPPPPPASMGRASQPSQTRPYKPMNIDLSGAYLTLAGVVLGAGFVGWHLAKKR